MEQNRLVELIKKVADQDRAAFDALYESTNRKLFGVCLRILGDRGQSEEVAQEVFIKIWRSAARFDSGKYSPMTWLITIARNTAIDTIRRQKPRQVELDQALDIADKGETPAQTALRKDNRRQIDDCLDVLKQDQRLAIQNAYFEGWSYQEIADHLEKPINTIRTWLRRGLLDLRTCLGGA